MSAAFPFLSDAGVLDLGLVAAFLYYVAYRIVRSDWGSRDANMARYWLVTILMVAGTTVLIATTVKLIAVSFSQGEPRGQQPRIEAEQIEEAPPQTVPERQMPEAEEQERPGGVATPP